ncbi:MAG: hypothetical protein ACOX40_04105 [Bacilli bacterium]
MKKLISDYRKLIIILIVPYIAIISMGLVTIDYNLVAPGGINPVTDVIEIENGNEIYQNFNTVYVYAPSKITVLEYLIGKVDRNFSVSKTSPYYIASFSEEREAGKIQKDTSITNSLIVAYEEASRRDANIKINYTYQGQIIDMVYSYTDPQLRIGDIIIEVDDQPINYPYLLTQLTSTHVSDAPTYKAKIVRDNKELFLTITKPKTKNDHGIPGFTHYELYEIIDANPSYNIEKSRTTGPSGGLMQALSIYANLINKDLAKGMVVCGTGTLEKNDKDEWIVGQIGGAYQKVIAAYRAGADVFFVPDGKNYEEALKAYQTLKNPKMDLVPVKTFGDALAYFEGKK